MIRTMMAIFILPPNAKSRIPHNTVTVDTGKGQFQYIALCQFLVAYVGLTELTFYLIRSHNCLYKHIFRITVLKIYHGDWQKKILKLHV